jgi:hypothetical protein
MGNFVDIIYGVPPLLRIALVFPLIAAPLTSAQLIMAVIAWRHKYWSVGERVYFTLMTAIVLVFTWWLDYWNLLGFRY